MVSEPGLNISLCTKGTKLRTLRLSFATFSTFQHNSAHVPKKTKQNKKQLRKCKVCSFHVAIINFNTDIMNFKFAK